MAITVTYEAPLSVQGTTTGPTTAQIAGQINEVSCSIVATLDADATATVIHNLGTGAVQLALGHPWVILEPLAPAAGVSLWAITGKTATNIKLTKGTGAGSGSPDPQVRCQIIRPSSAFAGRGIPGAA